MASIDNGSDLGIEASFFKAADKLRGNMEPSDYKHVALGLIFLKHISDGFEARQALLAEYPAGAEDPDEYLADNIFWVPKEARWSHLQASAKQPTIGKLIDEAMIAIEKVNESLKGVLPKDYGRPALNAVMLGELIDLISGIALGEGGTRRATSWAGSTNISSASSRAPRASAAASSTPPLGRAHHGRDARTLPGPRLRPLLRLGRHVRAVGNVRRGAWRPSGRHRHLWPGVELHHLAAVQDEPRRARHRRRHPLEQRGHLPQERTARPARRCDPGLRGLPRRCPPVP
jgi:hypothetical protein